MDIRAIVVAVGTELTSGQTADTNSSYLARRLAELGIVTVAHYVADDHLDRIADILTEAARQAEVVVVSGGLGPTADDVTRQALARAMGVELDLHQPSLTYIEGFFRQRNRPMHDTNRIQAMIPHGAEALHNPVGTAPGIYARLGEAQVFIVPGVPSEMRRMTEEHILPRLMPLAGQSCLVFRLVHTFGGGESDIAAKIADLMGRESNPLVGTTVAAGLVSVRIIARAAGREQARQMAEQMVQVVRGRLGEYAFGADEETLSSVVGQLLRLGRATLSVAESCTGGLLGELISAESGASDYFIGGVISYANRIKQSQLGVPEDLLAQHGAVSEPVAQTMATGVRERFCTDYAISITGVAGPTGGSPEKPVGLVYTALASPTGVRVQRNVLPGDRHMVRLRASLTALNMLRLDLLANPGQERPRL